MGLSLIWEEPYSQKEKDNFYVYTYRINIDMQITLIYGIILPDTGFIFYFFHGI